MLLLVQSTPLAHERQEKIRIITETYLRISRRAGPLQKRRIPHGEMFAEMLHPE